MRLPPWVANLLLTMASVGVVLGALEIAARVSRPQREGPVAALYTEHDPLLGWRHRPGARVPFPRGDYAINSLGLRDPERGYQPRAGHSRVLILGDSFAEGFSVRFEDSVSQVLERNLMAGGCRYEVINGGTVGYSTDQAYLFFREEGWRYRPEVVVLLLYYNDVLDNSRGSVGRAPKPLFTFTGGTARLANVPLPPPPEETETPGRRPGGSAALRWARERLRRTQPGAHDALASLGLWPRLEREAPGIELEVYSRKPPQAVTDAWNFTVHLLREVHLAVSGRGARLLVGYVPRKLEVRDADWQLAQRRYGVDNSVWDTHRVASLLAEAGARVGFPVLDLTGPLRQADRSWLGGPYHSHGGHWNALGHSAAAREIQRDLIERNWLSRCGTTTH